MQIQTSEKRITQNPSVLFQESEIRRMLTEAIESLPEMERLVISLYCYEELTLKEIESVLGIDEPCVAQLKSRAMLKLQPFCKLIKDTNAQSC
jgi:RNA polymerase sigma factor FliA